MRAVLLYKARKTAAAKTVAKKQPTLPTLPSTAANVAGAADAAGATGATGATKKATGAKKVAVAATPSAAPKKRGRPTKSSKAAEDAAVTPPKVPRTASAAKPCSLALRKPVMSLSLTRLEITADTEERARVCVVSMKHGDYDKAAAFVDAVKKKILAGKCSKDDVLEMRRSWKASGRLV